MNAFFTMLAAAILCILLTGAYAVTVQGSWDRQIRANCEMGLGFSSECAAVGVPLRR